MVSERERWGDERRSRGGQPPALQLELQYTALEPTRAGQEGMSDEFARQLVEVFIDSNAIDRTFA